MHECRRGPYGRSLWPLRFMGPWPADPFDYTQWSSEGWSTLREFETTCLWKLEIYARISGLGATRCRDAIEQRR